MATAKEAMDILPYKIYYKFPHFNEYEVLFLPEGQTECSLNDLKPLIVNDVNAKNMMLFANPAPSQCFFLKMTGEGVDESLPNSMIAPGSRITAKIVYYEEVHFLLYSRSILVCVF